MTNERTGAAAMDAGLAPAARPRVAQHNDLPMWADARPVTPVAVPNTQKAAYQRAQRDRLSKKEIIYAAIEAAGARGITRTELHAITNIKKDTVNGRCRDLVLEDPPRVVEVGQRGDEKVLYALRFAPRVT